MSDLSIKNISVFPVHVHQVTNLLDDEYHDFLLQECKNLEYMPSDSGLEQSKNSYLHKEDSFSKLILHIRSCLNSVKIADGYDTDEFKISQMWVNRSQQGAAHPQHWHSNSFFSGIYYLTEGSPTVFYDPVIGRQMSSLNVWAETTQPAIVLPAESKILRIFPSYLQHKTLPHDSEELRYTISFNTIPNGKTNTRNPYTRLSELQINV